MSGTGYFTRLAAAVTMAALMGAVIMKPGAGRDAVERIAASAPERAPALERACAAGEAPLSAGFANFEDVLSISPLGAVTAPDEPLPTPFIRINSRKGETVFQRRTIDAIAPARADVIAIERHVERDAEGLAVAESWTVRMQPCRDVTIYYDRLDEIEPSILRRAGGLAKFTEIGGPDHLAIATAVPLRAGELVGRGAGFDVGLYDLAAKPLQMTRPERYDWNPYEHAAVLDAPPTLLAAIAPEPGRARCALDYMDRAISPQWSGLLGDAFGMRKARGDNACRTALLDVPGTAQGAWFTDASHNALTSKVSTIALAPDSIDPERLVFALHGRLASLTPELIALSPFQEEQRAEATKDFLTFEKKDGRINAPFSDVKAGETYCYERLRANFVGPKINGIILLRINEAEGTPPLMQVEARGDAAACLDLPEPWEFSGNETTFYR